MNVTDAASRYSVLTSNDVKTEIFESVRRELRDEINIALEDQVHIINFVSVRFIAITCGIILIRLYHPLS